MAFNNECRNEIFKKLDIHIYIFFIKKSRKIFNKQESNYLLLFLLEIVNVFIMKLGIWFDGKDINDILIIQIMNKKYYNNNNKICFFRLQ